MSSDPISLFSTDWFSNYPCSPFIVGRWLEKHQSNILTRKLGEGRLFSGSTSKSDLMVEGHGSALNQSLWWQLQSDQLEDGCWWETERGNPQPERGSGISMPHTPPQLSRFFWGGVVIFEIQLLQLWVFFTNDVSLPDLPYVDLLKQPLLRKGELRRAAGAPETHLHGKPTSLPHRLHRRVLWNSILKRWDCFDTFSGGRNLYDSYGHYFQSPLLCVSTYVSFDKKWFCSFFLNPIVSNFIYLTHWHPFINCNLKIHSKL